MTVPTKASIRAYGLDQAQAMMEEEITMAEAAALTLEQVQAQDPRPLPVRVEVRVPISAEESEVVSVRGVSIQDAVDNATVAYGDAELVFPTPDDIVYTGAFTELA